MLLRLKWVAILHPMRNTSSSVVVNGGWANGADKILGSMKKKMQLHGVHK